MDQLEENKRSNAGGESMDSHMLSDELLNPQQVADEPLSATDVDEKINTLRETVLQLLQEVESLTISVPVNLKQGAKLDEEVRQFEVNLIRNALGRTAGSQTRAAKLLGLKLTTLNAKIKRYQIAPASYQAHI
jgi:transcriptional regulator with PAS, ATPase and Fis domain